MAVAHVLEICHEPNLVKVELPFKPLKITATRFGSICGHDDYATPFGAWCQMAGLYKEVLDANNKYLKAGKILEPRVVAYLKTFPEYRDRLYQVPDILGHGSMDIFQDNEIFGGVPDALIAQVPGVKPSGFDSVEEVVEIKTASNIVKWASGPPIRYLYQVAMYAYLLGIERMTLVCLDLTGVEIENTETLLKLPITRNNCAVYKMHLHQALPSIDSDIEHATKWWYDHITTGISPTFNEFSEYKFLTSVEMVMHQQSAPAASEKMRELEFLTYQVESIEALIAEKYSRITALKKELKPLYAAKKIPEVTGGCQLQLASKPREVIDKKALVKDGLSKYITTSSAVTFTVEKCQLVIKQEYHRVLVFTSDGEIQDRKVLYANGTITRFLKEEFQHGSCDYLNISMYRIYYIRWGLSTHEMVPILTLDEDTIYNKCVFVKLEYKCDALCEVDLLEEDIENIIDWIGGGGSLPDRGPAGLTHMF